MTNGRDFLIAFSDAITSTVNENVAERRIFYRLGDSEVFDYANKNTSINGMKMVDVIPLMILGDKGFQQVEFGQLDRTIQYELFEGPRYKLSCKRALRQLIETGAINMVYSEQYKIPTCIPYVVQGSGPKARVFVNITDFVQMDTYGKFQIIQARNYNGLMAAIFAAAVAVTIVRTGAALPADLGDGLVLVYAAMMERVINSIIHMDPITKDKVRYLATEFALIQMYGTEEGQRMFLNRFKTKYFPKLSKMITESLDAQFHLESFDKLSLFVLELKNLYPSMKGLSDYLIMDKWMRSFGAATALTIDYLGYHIYTVCMVLFESPLITRMALEPVMEKNRGADMYTRMQQMIGPQ